ncbi:MAG: hypothetical protein ABWY07_09550, partial [Burkholderiales bacterium]
MIYQRAALNVDGSYTRPTALVTSWPMRERCKATTVRGFRARGEMMATAKLWLLVPVLLLFGCAGKQDYVRPTTPTATSNSRVIEKPRDTVWNGAVP